MGKGSNVQKKQQAQLRNQKDRGKTEEERKAAAAKSKYVNVTSGGSPAIVVSIILLTNLCFDCFFLMCRRADASAFKCEVCLQTFMANARPPLLYQHVVAKHPDKVSDFLVCFPVLLKDFDPNDPKGEKKAAAEKATATKKSSKKTSKKKDDGLDDLLSAGLAGAKKKGKK